MGEVSRLGDSTLAGQFRCVFFADDFNLTLQFYEKGLHLPVFGGWDGSSDHGRLFQAASGIIEVLEFSNDHPYIQPKGIVFSIEVPDIDVMYSQLRNESVKILEDPQDQPWGHRTVRVLDPNGIEMVLFSMVVQDNN